MVFLLPDKQNSSVTTASVIRLALRFPAALSQDAHDALKEKTLDYMLLPSSSLPSVVCDEGKPLRSEELCSYWQQIGRMTNPDGTARFPHLTRLAKCILSLSSLKC